MVVGRPGIMTFCCSSPQRLLRFLFGAEPSDVVLDEGGGGADELDER